MGNLSIFIGDYLQWEDKLQLNKIDQGAQKSTAFIRILGALFFLVGEDQKLCCFFFKGERLVQRNYQLLCCGWAAGSTEAAGDWR